MALLLEPETGAGNLLRRTYVETPFGRAARPLRIIASDPSRLGRMKRYTNLATEPSSAPGRSQRRREALKRPWKNQGAMGERSRYSLVGIHSRVALLGEPGGRTSIRWSFRVSYADLVLHNLSTSWLIQNW